MDKINKKKLLYFLNKIRRGKWEITILLNEFNDRILVFCYRNKVLLFNYNEIMLAKDEKEMAEIVGRRIDNPFFVKTREKLTMCKILGKI